MYITSMKHQVNVLLVMTLKLFTTRQVFNLSYHLISYGLDAGYGVVFDEITIAAIYRNCRNQPQLKQHQPQLSQITRIVAPQSQMTQSDQLQLSQHQYQLCINYDISSKFQPSLLLFS